MATELEVTEDLEEAFSRVGINKRHTAELNKEGAVHLEASCGHLGNQSPR